MILASLRLIAADVHALVAFYEEVAEVRARWLAPVFAEIVTPAATLAIGSAETVALFQPGTAEPAANRSAILEFQVTDLDRAWDRLGHLDIVHAPKMLPWGNRTFQLRDPEGTLVSLYMPVTPEAQARFADRQV